MTFDVWTTAVASRQLQALRNVTRANAERAMDDLERPGRGPPVGPGLT